GITGVPGKCPSKNSSVPVTFFKATSPPRGSCSRTRSTSTKGYWFGICRIRLPMSIIASARRGRASHGDGHTFPSRGRRRAASGGADLAPALGLVGGRRRRRLLRRLLRGLLGRLGAASGLGRPLGLVRLGDHVVRHVEVLGGREHHAAVEKQ